MHIMQNHTGCLICILTTGWCFDSFVDLKSDIVVWYKHIVQQRVGCQKNIRLDNEKYKIHFVVKILFTNTR